MSTRRSWPYLRTPLAVFIVVMLPINAMMAFLITAGTPGWMKITSALVILLSIRTYVRGYVRQLVLTPAGAALRGVMGEIFLPWNDIRSIGMYVPGGGRSGTPYIYLSKHDRPPQGAWEIDPQTIQVQDRDGLLETIREAQRAHADAA